MPIAAVAVRAATGAVTGDDVPAEVAVAATHPAAINIAPRATSQTTLPVTTMR